MAKKKIPLKDPNNESFGNSFGALFQKSGIVTPKQSTTSKAKEEAKQEVELPDFSKTSKITIRRETKKRRGKTVTVLQGIEASNDSLKKLAKELRKQFGCGSTVEEAELILQGDQITKVRIWLEKKGAKKIVTSG